MTTTSSTFDTTESMVPAGTRPNGGAPRRRRRLAPWVAVVTAVLLAAAVVGAAFVPMPYYTLRPGSVRSIAELVTVVGAEAYPPEGEVGFTTVSVGQATLLEALGGWLDDDVDVLPEDAIRGDRTDEENRRFNVQLMTTSKLVASAVAFRHLGYDVSIVTEGTAVQAVAPDSPADGVLARGDVIVAVDGEPVDGIDELGQLLQQGGPGAEHVLEVERLGDADPVEVTLTTRPADDDPDRALIGIFGEDRIVDVQLPFDVAIDSADVGGPSAGLAFTLALIDLLTPGELTGGHRVAATGTMAMNGAVGPVGGAAQKAVAVRDAGFDLFLVPPQEYDEVVAAVDGQLDVAAVGTLSDALVALDSLGGNASASAASASGT